MASDSATAMTDRRKYRRAEGFWVFGGGSRIGSGLRVGMGRCFKKGEAHSVDGGRSREEYLKTRKGVRLEWQETAGIQGAREGLIPA